MNREGGRFGAEFHEGEPFGVEVLDASEFGEVPLEALAERSVAGIVNESVDDPSEEDFWRKKLRLPPEGDFDTALREFVPRMVDRFRRDAESKRAPFREQADFAARLAVERGYIQNPRPIRIVLTDPFFRRGFGSFGKRDGWDEYVTDLDTIFANPKHRNAFIAHEVGHALSTDLQNATSGFKRVVRTPDGLFKGKGNNLFNEGVTVVWEELSVNDGSKTGHSDSTSLYGWSRDMVRNVTELIGLDDDDLLRAYFGNEEAREKYDRALAKKFGATIEDLEGLRFRLDSELTKRILQGEPVDEEVSSNLDLQSGKYARLLRVFPNLTLKQKPRR